MNLNLPVPILGRQKFAEGSALAPFRDDRNTPQAWKKTRNVARQGDATLQAVNQIISKLSRQRRKPLGGSIPPKQEFQPFPFCIYNTTNITATADQIAQFTAAKSNIQNLTFQIREGVVGARSYLSIFAGSNVGNFEQFVVCQNTEDAPPDNSGSVFFPEKPNTGTCVILDNLNPTLISGIPSGSPPNTPQIQFSQIALNPLPCATDDANYPGGAWQASFWIEVVDDPNNGLYANLWGQMTGVEVGDTSSSRTLIPFPKGSNIIPIGIAYYGAIYGLANDGSIGVSIGQYLTSNLVSRFPPGFDNQRGTWNTVYGALPVGFTNLVWYPGDIVIDDTNPITDISGFTYYAIWKFIGVSELFMPFSSKPVAGSDWMQVGIINAD